MDNINRINNSNCTNSVWSKLFLGIFIIATAVAALWGADYVLSLWNIPLFNMINKLGDTMIMTVLILSLLIVGFVLFTGIAVGIVVFALSGLAALWILASIIFFPILFPVFLPIVLVGLFVLYLVKRKKRS